ncbi:AEC family transporter [Nitratireductor luteus]|uniref:AEC family transporter n=1 Tax=Nitratireductor luteus TaxID=2976980 RepID=UPI0022408415|nr:AEC family transporter [Nitratireductor luteus]
MAILPSILPLFAVIIVGFIAIRSGYVVAEQIKPVSDFVVKIALPALIFNALTSVPLAEAVSWSFMAAYAGGSMFIFLFGMLAARNLLGMETGHSALAGLGMANSNSAFMGYPIALTVIGAPAGALLAQCMIIENLALIPLAMAIADSARAGGGNGWRPALGQAARNVVRNPIILAMLAAVLVTVVGLPVPGVISSAIDMLARIAAPIALFVIGGTLASLPLAGVYRRVSLIVAGKLLLHPLIIFAALSLAPGISETTFIGGVIFASVPMLSIYPLLGQRSGMVLVTATALLVATVLSFITVPAAIAIVQHLQAP